MVAVATARLRRTFSRFSAWRSLLRTTTRLRRRSSCPHAASARRQSSSTSASLRTTCKAAAAKGSRVGAGAGRSLLAAQAVSRSQFPTLTLHAKDDNGDDKASHVKLMRPQQTALSSFVSLCHEVRSHCAAAAATTAAARVRSEPARAPRQAAQKERLAGHLLQRCHGTQRQTQPARPIRVQRRRRRWWQRRRRLRSVHSARKRASPGPRLFCSRTRRRTHPCRRRGWSRQRRRRACSSECSDSSTRCRSRCTARAAVAAATPELAALAAPRRAR